MSRSVDLFISSPEPLDAVATKISDLAKVSVVAGPDGRWEVREGDTSASLYEHRYIDDGDLFLSHYQYVLSGQAPATSRPQDTPEAALLRRVGSVLQQGTSWPVLLVLDLQYREQVSATPAAAGAGEREGSNGSTP
ncbi:MAG TPA: hypothetical protein VNF71_06760 [Acidimicrobiales bacterium]|nr:hypothetical protein [Acidimicrobiales bacterium]